MCWSSLRLTSYSNEEDFQTELENVAAQANYPDDKDKEYMKWSLQEWFDYNA